MDKIFEDSVNKDGYADNFIKKTEDEFRSNTDYFEETNEKIKELKKKLRKCKNTKRVNVNNDLAKQRKEYRDEIKKLEKTLAERRFLF